MVSIPSGEFSKICKELYSISESVTVNCTQDFVQFSVDGELGTGSVKLGNDKGDSTTLEVSE